MRRKASRPFCCRASISAWSTASRLRGTLTAPRRSWFSAVRNARRIVHLRAHTVNRELIAARDARRSSALSVDLRHHVLDLEVVLERVRAEVLAVAGLLEAAVRHLRDERDVVVDPDRPELELLRRVQRASDVAGPDRGGEAVVDVVRPRDRLVVLGEPLHGHDRPEHLALDDLVLLAHVGDD